MNKLFEEFSKQESEKVRERVKVQMYTRVGRKEQLDMLKEKLTNALIKGWIDEIVYEEMFKRIEAKYK